MCDKNLLKQFNKSLKEGIFDNEYQSLSKHLFYKITEILNFIEVEYLYPTRYEESYEYKYNQITGEKYNGKTDYTEFNGYAKYIVNDENIRYYCVLFVRFDLYGKSKYYNDLKCELLKHTNVNDECLSLAVVTYIMLHELGHINHFNQLSYNELINYTNNYNIIEQKLYINYKNNKNIEHNDVNYNKYVHDENEYEIIANKFADDNFNEVWKIIKSEYDKRIKVVG